MCVWFFVSSELNHCYVLQRVSFYFRFWRSKSDVWKLCILHIHGVCFLSRHLIILKDLEHIFHIGFAMHNVFDYGDWANRSSHFSTQFFHLSIDIHGLNLIRFSFICQFKNARFIRFFFLSYLSFTISHWERTQWDEISWKFVTYWTANSTTSSQIKGKSFSEFESIEILYSSCCQFALTLNRIIGLSLFLSNILSCVR